MVNEITDEIINNSVKHKEENMNEIEGIDIVSKIIGNKIDDKILEFAEKLAKEDDEMQEKMENKIKIDDKVVLRTDIAFQLPYTIVKGTILNVDLIQFGRARVSTPVVSFVVPLEFLIKVGEDENKENIINKKVRYIDKITNINLTRYNTYDVLEECKDFFVIINDNGKMIKCAKHHFIIVKDDEINDIMVVRKLQDFTFLKSENYEIRVDENKNHIIVVDTKGMIICEINVKYSEMLKQLGFSFEYNPPKSKDELIQDVILSGRKIGSNHRSMILFDTNENKYIFTDDYANIQDVGVYYTEDLAEKFCNELNEILEGENNEN